VSHKKRATVFDLNSSVSNTLLTYLFAGVFQVIFETPNTGSMGRQQMAMQSSLPLQQEIFYTNQQPGSVLYDDYNDYRSGQFPSAHRPTRIDSANDGVYRGEIQLDRGRSRGSYGEQETRFT